MLLLRGLGLRSFGIDLSTTATGLVALQASGGPQPTLLGEWEITAPKLDGIARHKYIVTKVMTLLHQFEPDQIVVEGYSLNFKNAASVVPLCEIGGILRLMLVLDKLTWLDPSAGELKGFATGKGNSPKEIVMLNVYKRWGFEASSNNVADAYVLACMGLAKSNHLPGITKEMQKIADKLTAKSN